MVRLVDGPTFRVRDDNYSTEIVVCRNRSGKSAVMAMQRVLFSLILIAMLARGPLRLYRRGEFPACGFYAGTSNA
jgi:hypothetical protein